MERSRVLISSGGICKRRDYVERRWITGEAVSSSETLLQDDGSTGNPKDEGDDKGSSTQRQEAADPNEGTQAWHQLCAHRVTWARSVRQFQGWSSKSGGESQQPHGWGTSSKISMKKGPKMIRLFNEIDDVWCKIQCFRTYTSTTVVAWCCRLQTRLSNYAVPRNADLFQAMPCRLA